MTKHDEARRAFLLGAAVGAGAVAGATLVPDALAQTPDAPTTGTATGSAHSHAGGPGLGAVGEGPGSGGCSRGPPGRGSWPHAWETIKQMASPTVAPAPTRTRQGHENTNLPSGPRLR